MAEPARPAPEPGHDGPALPRLVLDTNVVLDCLLFDDVRTRPLWAAIQRGAVCVSADAATLEELRRVLAYRQFGLTPTAQAACFAHYATCCQPSARVAALPALPRCRDPDDQKFLELATAAHADLLVTKDRALLRLSGRTRLGFGVLDPAAACAALNLGAGAS